MPNGKDTPEKMYTALGRIMRAHPTTIKNWVNGKNHPSGKHITQWLKLMSVAEGTWRNASPAAKEAIAVGWWHKHLTAKSREGK